MRRRLLNTAQLLPVELPPEVPRARWVLRGVAISASAARRLRGRGLRRAARRLRERAPAPPVEPNRRVGYSFVPARPDSALAARIAAGDGR